MAAPMRNERVYTVYDYYDGPRQGMADFRGRPHAYHCLWDATKRDYTNRFRLKPLTQEEFAAVLADWEIWLRWRRAFDAGLATIDSHPALPEDAAEHERLKQLVTAAYHVPDDALVARGTFRMDETLRDLVVSWRVVARSD
jgi:hypothetical protein